MTGKRIVSLMIIAGLLCLNIVAVSADQVVVREAVRVQSEVSSGATAMAQSTVDEKNAEISKDEAKAIALKALKDYFGTQLDEKKYETEISFRQDYELRETFVWDIQWHMYNEEKSVNINVSIDANKGKIFDIRKHEYFHGQDSRRIATITQEQAEVLAQDFIKKVNPDKYKQLSQMEDEFAQYRYGTGSAEYYFKYVRQIDGVPFDANYISVEIDGVDKRIISYSCRWNDEADIPSRTDVISKEKAEEIYREKLKMSLQYIPYGDRYDYSKPPKKIKLVYAPGSAADDYYVGVLDAKSGTMTDLGIVERAEQKVKDITGEEKEKIYRKNTSKAVKEIDQNEASKRMTDIVQKMFGDGYTIESLRYSEQNDYWETNGQKSWSAQFSKEEGSMRYDYGGRITIDAKSGQLISLYRHYDFEMQDTTQQPKLTWEKAYDKAIEMIGKYYPEKIKDIDTKQIYMQSIHYINDKQYVDRTFYFNFQRMVNGVPYSNNQISIGFDAYSGMINDIRCRWDEDAQFPSVEGVLGEEKAEEIYFESSKLQLAYMAVNKSKDLNKPQMEVVLIYRIKPAQSGYQMGYVDALTGEVVGYDGEVIKSQQNDFEKKIHGHWAEKQLNILAFQGIIDPKAFEMDKEATWMDVVKMLVNTKGYEPYMLRSAEPLKIRNIKQDHDDYKYLQMAVMYGILDNTEEPFNREVNITREEMAQLVVKMLQYDKLAKSSDIFKLPFTDAQQVSKDRIGYVAIGVGLGIFEGDNGAFRPLDNATMVEVASTVYKALGSMK
ncbi:YcdB/YcdC domain-containing protein [Petroclostridium sp. X23]|uniref:YcdB/YcdC domain-containing protein n=1 Tax=Petroclostridium sp. X23 TaxID=3045146 RepID=UPI0024AC92B9|nr:YcdB/YcdC domain-containing protein [Petroclostridium sp. X23]WHH61418.1 S-layer homology domain-containing protein [Petroclostridium sp. X23]